MAQKTKEKIVFRSVCDLYISTPSCTRKFSKSYNGMNTRRSIFVGPLEFALSFIVITGKRVRFYFDRDGTIDTTRWRSWVRDWEPYK